MPNDSIAKTIGVATVVCVVCSVFVSTAAVMLKPKQERNKTLDRKKNIVIAAGLLEEGGTADIDQLFKKIDTKLIDIATGKYIDNIDPEKFDSRKAAKQPETSVTIEDDVARIKRCSKIRPVYLLREGKQIKRVILPVYGKGLWSTMYGFLALDSDLQTIKSFAFYEHGETPGLGGEVDNPKWKAIWTDKKAFDKNGQPKIEVVKGTVNPNSTDAPYEVDGLSGATITGRGVSNLLHFWLGPEGYGPFLAKLRKEGHHG